MNHNLAELEPWRQFIAAIGSYNTVKKNRFWHYVESKKHRGLRAWLLLPEQTAHNNDPSVSTEFFFTVPRQNKRITIFPEYPELVIPDLSGLKKDHHYLANETVINVGAHGINSIIPYECIGFQIHEHGAKVVWKPHARQKYNLTDKFYSDLKNFTVGDWEKVARNPESLLDRYSLSWRNETSLELASRFEGLVNTVQFALNYYASYGKREGYTAYPALIDAFEKLYEWNRPQKTEYQNYQKFLNSPEWEQKRLEVRRRSQGWCEWCKPMGMFVKAAHVHHLNYAKPWGQEAATDLVHLCGKHHKLAHGNVDGL